MQWLGKFVLLLSCHQFDPPQIARAGRPSPRTPCARCRARSSCASWAARRRPSLPSRRSASTSAGARSSGPSSSSSGRTARTSSSGRARTWCPAATPPPRATAAPTRAAEATRTCARAPRISLSVTTRPCPRRGGSSPTTARVLSQHVSHKVTNCPRVRCPRAAAPSPAEGDQQRPRGLAGVSGRGAALAGLRAEGGTQARGGAQTQELDALRRGWPDRVDSDVATWTLQWRLCYK